MWACYCTRPCTIRPQSISFGLFCRDHQQEFKAATSKVHLYYMRVDIGVQKYQLVAKGSDSRLMLLIDLGPKYCAPMNAERQDGS